MNKRPGTLAYGLVDSPVAQLAWNSELFFGFEGEAVEMVDRDLFLTHTSIYWFTATGGSAAAIDAAAQKRIAVVLMPPHAPGGLVEMRVGIDQTGPEYGIAAILDGDTGLLGDRAALDDDAVANQDIARSAPNERTFFNAIVHDGFR